MSTEHVPYGYGIGSRVRARRLELGLTGQQLGERLGQPRQRVYTMEATEDAEHMRVSTLIAFARALDTTVPDLLGDHADTDAYTAGYAAGRRDGIAWCIGTLTQEATDAL